MKKGNKKLALFKLEEDVPVCVGFLDTDVQVEEYFKQIQHRIDLTMQKELEGDYFVVPAIHFKVQQTPIVYKNKDVKTKTKTKK